MFLCVFLHVSLRVSAPTGAASVVVRPNVRINLMLLGAAAVGGPTNLGPSNWLVVLQSSLARGQAYVGATATDVTFWPNH